MNVILFGADGVPKASTPVAGSTALDDLTDVVITGAAQGDILIRGGSNWQNQNIGTNEIVGRLPSGDVDGIAMAASTILARLASGNIVAATVAEIKTLLGLRSTACSLSKSSTQTINNTTAALTFDTEITDTDTMHSTVSNTSRITVPADGYYLVQSFAFANGGLTGFKIQKNGTTDIITTTSSGGLNPLEVFGTVLLAANDYVEALVTTIANRAVDGLFTVTYIGP